MFARSSANASADTRPGSRRDGGPNDRRHVDLLSKDADNITDAELLEALLVFGARDRRVSHFVHELLVRFGNFGEVIAQTPVRLSEVPGLDERVGMLFRAVRFAATRLAQQKASERPILSSSKALIRYCRIAMAHEQTERLRILFLDRKNVLIADEVQQTGTIDHTPVYPREIIKRALELNASALILVHNHPSGDPTPSHADIAVTIRIAESARHLGIEIHDHLVIGKGRHTSFKALGLL